MWVELLTWIYQTSIDGYSAVFGTWAPKFYAYYEENLDKLLKHDPSLRKSFPSVVPGTVTE